MPKPHHPASYSFGRFELNPAERRLLDQGRPAPLHPRAFDLLLALVERSGELVTKDELLKRVWTGLVVEEGNLQVQMSALRKVLGAEAIETVSGHGYRFAQAVGAVAARAHAGSGARLTNLPRELTSFVGREVELAEQTRRLQATRLLTITGGGGLGKSRLSLRLAAGVTDQYSDGVWLVELAAVADPLHVIAAFAAALGVVAERGASLRDAVVAYVRNRRLLLVVDNCEHVLAAVADVAKALLQWAPLVKLIATSREPLHVAGEALCPLTPLALPDARRSPDVDEAMQSPSVGLFVARAAAAQAGFSLSPRNVGAVVDICRRLDGIPLAIELAAARTRVMAVEAVAQRLGDRFRLLNTGDRTALPRHQTLRAVIDWSYDLLTSEERSLLRRLAVFAGGFTLAAAEAISQNGSVDDDVLDLLCNLVDKSLVIADSDRYHMLETVRQYAHDRLAESGEEAQLRDRHLAYFLAFAEAAEPEFIGRDQGMWYTRLDDERENLLAAYAQCAHAEDGARRGLRLVCALRMFWQVRGPLPTGYQLALEALARPGTEARDYTRCQALFTAAIYAYYLGRIAEARTHAEACLSIARERADLLKASDALVTLAIIAVAQSDLAQAREFAGEALSLAHASGDKMRTMQALGTMGERLAAEHDLDGADARYTESLALALEIGERGTATVTLINLARTASERRSFKLAAARLLEAAEIIDETGTQQLLLNWLAIASGLAADMRDWRRAAMLFGAVRARSKADGYELEPVDNDYLASRIEQCRTALGEAAFAEAEASGAALTDSHWMAEARDWVRQVAA